MAEPSFTPITTSIPRNTPIPLTDLFEFNSGGPYTLDGKTATLTDAWLGWGDYDESAFLTDGKEWDLIGVTPVDRGFPNPSVFVSIVGSVELGTPAPIAPHWTSVSLIIYDDFDGSQFHFFSQSPRYLVENTDGSGWIYAFNTGGTFDVIGDVFTESADTVNFNSLTPEQVTALENGDARYDARGGDDTVLLPNKATVVPGGWDEGTPFNGGSGSDKITGGDRNDRIYGGDDRDIIRGGHGNDILNGGPGNDVIQGIDSQTTGAKEAGNNDITGGEGFDTVRWSASFGSYVKKYSVSFEAFARGEFFEMSVNSVNGSDALKDKIENMSFGGVKVPYKQFQAIAGFKWALETANALLEKAVELGEVFGGTVPDSAEPALKWLAGIREIIILAHEPLSSGDLRVLFINSNVLLVKALQTYTDAQVPGSSEYTAEYYEKLEGIVRADAGATYDWLMKQTLPVAEDLGEWWGDYWHGVTDKLDAKIPDLKKHQAPASVPFDLDLQNIELHKGTDGDDEIIIQPLSVVPLLGSYHTFTFTGDGNDNVVGSSLNDYIVAGAGNDQVYGMAGDDAFVAGNGEGDDLYDGGVGVDVIIYSSTGAGVTVRLSANQDQAHGAEIGTDQIANVENIVGGDGNDQIAGNRKANLLEGGGGDDRIFGGPGNDLLRGGSGADVLHGGAGADKLIGNGGKDKLLGRGGNDRLIGGGGDDVLRGGGGNDVLKGGPGSDRLIGGSGNDWLFGGPGKETLIGGPDADTFVYKNIAHIGKGAGKDIIKDLNPGEDMLDLSRIDANTLVNGNQEFTFIGGANFSAAGQLRYDTKVLAGDVNGDGKADFQILFANSVAVSSDDLIL